MKGGGGEVPADQGQLFILRGMLTCRRVQVDIQIFVGRLIFLKLFWSFEANHRNQRPK